MRLPFAINSYRHRSLPVSAQRLVNWLPEAQPADAKARVVLLPSPGLVLFATLPQGPVRAMHVMGATLYAVGGGALYRVTSAGAVTFVGNIDGSGAVSMADNGTQVIVVEPVSRKAWVATETTFQQITSPDFDTPVCVAVVDGYAAFAKADSNQFFLSEIRDALTYDALDFASKEASPDNLVSLQRVGTQLWLLGEKTTEIWSDIGASSDFDFPFRRVSGAFVERGCAAAFSVATGADTVFWLGDDKCVYVAEGFKPKRISTHAVEQALAGYSRVDDARGWFYEQEGHQFYVLSFPDAGETWVFDLTTGAWHERESEGYDTWRCICGVAFATGTIAGDARDGRLYRVDTVLYDEAGEEIRRSVTGTTLHAEQKMLRFVRFEAEMESGTGLAYGQGVEPYVWLQYSDDGGRTWSNERWATLGRQGRYRTQLRWGRLGAARNRVFRLSMSDPVRTALIAADIEAEVGT